MSRQQSIDSKIYRIGIQDIVVLHLLCSFQRLVFSRCREMRAKDIHTHAQKTYTHMHTHTHDDDYRMPLGLRPPRHNQPVYFRIPLCMTPPTCKLLHHVCEMPTHNDDAHVAGVM